MTVITLNDFAEHLKDLDIFLQKLVKTALKLSKEKSLFGFIETDYLGLWFREDGVIPLAYKSYDINTIDHPATVCEIIWFIGIVNYYWEM